ncbi:MAG: HAD-IIIA family hydrolase [Coriobacteriia bacterium]|nr:HAD-IIIA family hydrolase [Coriobacteriia bacterium]
MLKEFYPYEYVLSVFDIDFQALFDQGFRALIFDIDNTLVHHGDPCTPEVDALMHKVQDMGFKVLLLSDNTAERIEAFMENFTAPYIDDAGKPNPEAYLRAVDMLGIPKERAVYIGDQVFTDIRGANAAGLPSILVHFIQVPGETKIGKKRYIEKMIVKMWRKNPTYAHRLGSITLV